ncbi:hypothetical protein [Pedobacter sp. BAL39]|uniref:hypothetical protein n=1 Tax=Pedobacter sp. BAL39 TaxID=391596 RepID=UPI0012FB6EFA|nr:hypothetical protein [Pedobacter sp. BAL39]
MKRILIGIVAIGITVFLAFSSNATDLEKKFSVVEYINIGGGTYILDRKDTTCLVSDPNRCRYFFPNPANNTPVFTFTLPFIPTNLGVGVQSGPFLRI